MQFIVGVDVGGTLLRAARFDQELTLIERAEQRTEAGEGTGAVVSRLIETIRQVLPEAPQDLLGIGLAMPGPLDPDTGMIIRAANVPMDNFPIVRVVQEAVGGRVFLGNDADLAGLAEYQLGAGRGARTMIYMTISTGIGGGLIIDGKLHTGRGQAGEIGHTVVDPNGPICGCGKRGHLEAVASGTAIARIARERLAAGEPSLLREMAGDTPAQIDARMVCEAAQAGDALAHAIMTQAGRYIGISIASLMMLLNPDRFVLGGGVMQAGDLLLEPLHAAIHEYGLHPRYWENTPIVRAELGKDVGLYGAAALVQMHLGRA